jgi:hypothetical protein
MLRQAPIQIASYDSVHGLFAGIRIWNKGNWKDYGDETSMP